MRLTKRHLIPAAGLVALLAMGACGADGSSPGRSMDGMGHGSSSSPSTAQAGRDGDVMFTQMMIPHHQGAVTMAQQVLSTSSDAQVKKLAQGIIDGQKKEIATMQGLLG